MDATSRGILTRIRTALALALTALPLGGCQSVLFASLNTTNPRNGVEQRRGLVFDAAHRLALDVYRPAQAERAPLVVFFYGGSWVRGERAWYRFVGSALAARGVVVAIPDYRKLPGVGLDGFMRDAATAVAWTRAHAAEFGADADATFVMGHSAGGHVAALLATDPEWLGGVGLRPRDLAGWIGLAGVYTFLPDDADDDDMLAVFGATAASRRRASPLAWVTGAEPPTLLLHGSADHEVDPANSRLLADAMRAAHDDVTLKLYPGIGHSALLFALSQPLRAHAPTLDDVAAFVQARAATRDAPADSPSGAAR
ncbi:MAG TPA: alpha/beta hydrolase [Dokdonella sp.]